MSNFEIPFPSALLQPTIFKRLLAELEPIASAGARRATPIQASAAFAEFFAFLATARHVPTLDLTRDRLSILDSMLARKGAVEEQIERYEDLFIREIGSFDTCAWPDDIDDSISPALFGAEAVIVALALGEKSFLTTFLAAFAETVRTAGRRRREEEEEEIGGDSGLVGACRCVYTVLGMYARTICFLQTGLKVHDVEPLALVDYRITLDLLPGPERSESGNGFASGPPTTHTVSVSEATWLQLGQSLYESGLVPLINHTVEDQTEYHRSGAADRASGKLGSRVPDRARQVLGEAEVDALTGLDSLCFNLTVLCHMQRHRTLVPDFVASRGRAAGVSGESCAGPSLRGPTGVDANSSENDDGNDDDDDDVGKRLVMREWLVRAWNAFSVGPHEHHHGCRVAECGKAGAFCRPARPIPRR